MIIEAKQLTKQFGSFKAVASASFSVNKGEVVGFVGANGAGKSTTINMLMGFINPSEGSVKLFGKLVTPATANRQLSRVGFAAGDMELPRDLKGEQYLQFIASLHRKDVRKRKAELVELFSPQLGKKIGTLSRGNKQKIALIGAFLTSPELVILDEPTSGLDPIMQEAFLDLVRSEQARGVTVFMSSHYLTEVADVCSRVMLMRSGEIIEDVPASELLARGGKTISVQSGIVNRPPKGAINVEVAKADGIHTLQFTWTEHPRELQNWVAGLKQLIDIEITEHNLEGAFKGMYDSEGKA